MPIDKIENRGYILMQVKEKNIANLRKKREEDRILIWEVAWKSILQWI